MQPTMSRLVTAALALLFLAGAAVRPADAEEIFAITARTLSGVALFSFDSAAPGLVSAPVPVTGIGPFQQILSIDFRPATGALYGFGGQNLLYTFDTATGAATQVSPVRPGLATVSQGLDFNPVTDEIRVFSRGPEGSLLRNVRINPDTGVVIFDTPLNYAPGDPNFGRTPNVQGLAYTNNVAGVATTALYGIDVSTGSLVSIRPESAGTMRTVGSLGLNINLLAIANVGFDISGVTGTAYAAITPIPGPGANVGQLYTVDLGTGAAVLVGPIGDGTLPAIGISVAPAVIPEPTTLLLLGTGLMGAGLAAVRRRRKAGASAQS